MNQCEFDHRNVHQLHMAMSNMYSCVASINFTTDTYSIIQSKLKGVPVSYNIPGFKDFALKYFTSCHPEDLNDYPLVYDFDSLIDHLENNNGIYSFEIRFEAMPSIYHWYEGTYFIVDNKDSDDLLLLLLFKDVNEKKLVEANLRDTLISAQIAAKAKTDFLSNMSQNLRTPINLMVSMNEIAKENIDDKEKVLDCLIKMDISSRYLFQLIDNVLEMSEIEAGKFNINNNPFDLAEVLEEMKAVYSKQAIPKEIVFHLMENYNDLNNLIGDVFRLKQILKTLLSNSFKYAPAEGIVTVEVLLNKIVYNRAFFSFIIENNGPALDEDIKERIFMPFVKGASSNSPFIFSGLGLGLSLCKNVVELLGGSIKASNNPNNNFVRFEVNVSFEIQENGIPNDLDLLADSAYFRFPEKRILVVENNEQDYNSIKALLEVRGISVDLAINGLEAVEAFEASDCDFYDLILMNVDLPVMSGCDATNAIRNSFNVNGSTIPIVGLVNHNMQQDILRALEAGMNEHILKPVDMNKLFSSLKNYI